MNAYIKKLVFLPALIAALGLMPAGRIMAETFTFGSQVRSTNTASLTYNSGTGMFQYTDAANSSDDSVTLPLTGAASTQITTTNDWIASLTANISAGAMTGTVSESPHVWMYLGFYYKNASNTHLLTFGLHQENNTGGANDENYPNGFYGTDSDFRARTNGNDDVTTPLGESQYIEGGSVLLLSGETNASPATESIGAATAELKLSYNASTETVTGYCNGTPVGSYSLASWGVSPPLTFFVGGSSGDGVGVSAGTATASNFYAGSPMTLPIAITTSNNPAGAGTSSAKVVNTTNVTLTAKANPGAAFLDWTVHGVVLSTNSTYTFTPASSETVTANFGYAVTTSSSPAAGGTTVGAGVYTNGQRVTVIANAAGCYNFVNWTQKSKVVSANASYPFTVTNGEALVANFTLKEDAIATASNPARGGTTTGKGTYGCGKTVTVKATAATGYRFIGWSAGGGIVSTSNPYIFIAGGAETLTANFSDVSTPTLTITSPTANEKVDTTLLTVSGTAKNVLGVSSVVLTLNNNPVSVTTSSGWTNWSASVILSPGANVISARAESQADHPSATETVTFENTAGGEAPVALAGLVGEVQVGSNAPFEISFGAATYEQFSADTNQGSRAGNYTYTQTGADTATLVTRSFVPVVQTNETALTFTSPSTATFTNEDGTPGTLELSPGMGLDVSSLSGWTVTSLDTASNRSTTTYGDETFTRTNSDSTISTGRYICMQYGPMAIRIVGTNANSISGVETDFTMVMFTSRSNGQWFTTHYESAGSQPTYDSGVFTGAYHANGLHYLAPETLNGVSATVTQLKPEAGPSFNITFGQATLSQTTSSTNDYAYLRSCVANYVYTRTGTNTAVLNMIDYLPPAGGGYNGSRILLTFKSATSLTFVNPNTSGSGTITTSLLPQSKDYAPLSLPEAIITTGSGSGGGSVTNDYGSFTTKKHTGTYTYAPFSPTVGMIVFSYPDTDPTRAGEVDYIQMTFNSATGGQCFIDDNASSGVIINILPFTLKP